MSLVDTYKPYLNLRYEAGIQDCYTLLHDLYNDLHKIPLRNYARPTGWEGCPELNFFEELFKREGFEVATNNVLDVKPFDVLLMAIGGEKVNHCAIHVGQNMILHHLIDRRSALDSYTHQWRRRVKYVIRHKDREAKMCRHGMQILELLPPHLQMRLARRLEEAGDK